MVGLGLQSLFEDHYGLTKAIAFEMFVDFLDDGFDESVAFRLLLNSFDYKIDFFVILARGVVLSVDRLLESVILLVRSARPVGWRVAFFGLIAIYSTLALSLATRLVLLYRFIPLRLPKDILVLR